MHSPNDKNNLAKHSLSKFPDFTICANSDVDNVSKLEKPDDDLQIQVDDDIDEKLQEPNVKSENLHNHIEIPKEKHVVTIDNKDSKSNEISSINNIYNCNYKPRFKGKSGKKVIKEISVITIHGTKFVEAKEQLAQEGANAPRKTRSKQNVPLVRKLTAVIPPPACPDSSVPLLRERDLKARNKFIKCALIILLIMIVITALFTVYVLITPEVKLYFTGHGWEIMLPAILLLVIADCGMLFSLCARTAPWNFIYLILTVIPMSLLSAKISAFFNTEVVLYGIVSTGVVVFVCIFLACSTFDFTNWIAIVLMIAVVFAALASVINISMAITGKMLQPLPIAILYAGTIFQVVMLTIQLQMILGKNNVIQIGVDDHCLAAFLLYTSILDICIRSVHIYALTDK